MRLHASQRVVAVGSARDAPGPGGAGAGAEAEDAEPLVIPADIVVAGIALVGEISNATIPNCWTVASFQNLW